MNEGAHSKVTVVEDVALEAKLLTRVLAEAGYARVTSCQDMDGALAEVSGGSRIVLTDIALGASSGLDLIRRIRARRDGDYVYIIAMTGRGATSLADAFAAGADDFLAKPVRPEELRARLHAAERILGLEALLRAQAHELDVALRRIDVAAAQRALARAAAVVSEGGAGDTPLEKLQHTAAFKELEKTVGASLSDFLQVPFTAATVAAAPTFAAEIALSDPKSHLEVAIDLLSDEASMKGLANHLLGEEDLEGAQALVLEVANVVMGSMKTALLGAGFEVTGGLPSTVTIAEAKSAYDSSAMHKRLGFASSVGALQVLVRAAHRRNQRVSAKSLKEGMILGDDVRDANGMLLMRGGTRLTQFAAERLARVAGDMLISIVEPLAA